MWVRVELLGLKVSRCAEEQKHARWSVQKVRFNFEGSGHVHAGVYRAQEG